MLKVKNIRITFTISNEHTNKMNWSNTNEKNIINEYLSMILMIMDILKKNRR